MLVDLYNFCSKFCKPYIGLLVVSKTDLFAVFQLMAIGGPQPQSDIEFAIAADDVAKVSSGGLIDALGLGVVKVKGYAVGVSGESGEVIVYSEVSACSLDSDLLQDSGILIW